MKNWQKALAIGTAALVGSVLALAAVTQFLAGRSVDAPYPDITASAEPHVIERGAYLAYGASHCSACHLKADSNKSIQQGERPPLSGGTEWDLPGFGHFFSSNLTSDGATGLGEWTDGEIARAIRYGVRRDGTLSLFMSFSVGQVSDQDLTALVSFLRSTEPVVKENRVSEAGPVGKVLAAYSIRPKVDTQFPKVSPPSEPSSVARGEYLATGPALCMSCHSKADLFDNYSLSQHFGGGDLYPSDGGMEIVAPNITSHPTGRMSTWTAAELGRRFAGPRLIENSPMPWIQFGNMSAHDVESIFMYLRSVEPVDHDVGPTYRVAGWEAPDESAGLTNESPR